ncbi:MAG: DUF4294 domain-containing protein [Chitinophagaceae bacterium]
MKLLKRHVVFTTLMICGVFTIAEAQQVPNMTFADSSHLYFAIVVGKDTIPWVVLPEVDVYAYAPAHLQKKVEEWNRLVNAVYVTYPYARIAAGVLNNVNAHLATAHYTRRERKQYLKEQENVLKQKFGPSIEDLSVYQGRILIKLINRETGTNCYDIIKEMRGGFSARLWQTVAFVFGSNLKSTYNKQEDADIESIVETLESNPYYYNAYYYSIYQKYRL